MSDNKLFEQMCLSGELEVELNPQGTLAECIRAVERCTLPLTGTSAVDLIITDLCVLSCDKKAGGLKLHELAPGVTIDRVRARTGAVIQDGYTP